MENKKRFGKIYKENMLSENKIPPPIPATKLNNRGTGSNMPSMQNKYVFDMDYKTLYEQAMQELEKIKEKNEQKNDKKTKKEEKNNDEIQYKSLYQELIQENNKLKKDYEKNDMENKKIIKELTDTIEKLNNKIDTFNTKSYQNNIDNVEIEKTKKYQDLLEENKRLKLFENENKTNKLDDELKFELENKYKEETKILKEEYEKQIRELKEKNKEYKNNESNNRNKVPTEKEDKKKDRRNKGKPILERFPIYIYNVTDEDAKNDQDIKNLLYFANMEEYIIMNHNSDIVDEVDKLSKVDIEFLVDYRLKYEKKNITKDSKLYMTRKIMRSKDLFRDYKEKLCKVKFSLSSLSKMSNNDYIEWKNELNKILNNVEIDNNDTSLCSYIIKSGKRKGLPCGKINCMRHKSH